MDNANKHLCVVCSTFIPVQNTVFCMKCQKPCKPALNKTIQPATNNSFGIYDYKSDCCNYDIYIGGMQITCSAKCHSELIEIMEAQFGKYKKITDATTNISYRIPTRDVIENGVTQQDLQKYPVWKDG